MHTLQATPVVFAVPKKALWLMMALILGVVLSLTAVTGYALDLVAFAGIAGPLVFAQLSRSTALYVAACLLVVGFFIALAYKRPDLKRIK